MGKGLSRKGRRLIRRILHGIGNSHHTHSPKIVYHGASVENNNFLSARLDINGLLPYFKLPESKEKTQNPDVFKVLGYGGEGGI